MTILESIVNNGKKLALTSFITYSNLFSSNLDHLIDYYSKPSNFNKSRIENVNLALNKEKTKLSYSEYWKVFKLLYEDNNAFISNFPKSMNNKMMSSSVQFLQNIIPFIDHKELVYRIIEDKSISELRKYKLPKGDKDLNIFYNSIQKANLEVLINLPSLFKNGNLSYLKAFSHYILTDFSNYGKENFELLDIQNKISELNGIESEVHKNEMANMIRTMYIGLIELKSKNNAIYNYILSLNETDNLEYTKRVDLLENKCDGIISKLKFLRVRDGISYSKKADKVYDKFLNYKNGKNYSDFFEDNLHNLNSILNNDDIKKVSFLSFVESIVRQPLYVLDVFKNINRGYESLILFNQLQNKKTKQYGLDISYGYNFLMNQSGNVGNLLKKSSSNMMVYSLALDIVEEKLFELFSSEKLLPFIGGGKTYGIDNHEELINGLDFLINNVYHQSNRKNFLRGLFDVLVLPFNNLRDDFLNLLDTPKLIIDQKKNTKEIFKHVFNYGIRTGLDIYGLKYYDVKDIAKNFSIHFALDELPLTKKLYRNAYARTAISMFYYMPQKNNLSLYDLELNLKQLFNSNHYKSDISLIGKNGKLSSNNVKTLLDTFNQIYQNVVILDSSMNSDIFKAKNMLSR